MKNIVWSVFWLLLSMPIMAAEPDPETLGRKLVDDSISAETRMQLIADHPRLAAEILSAMGAETQPGTPQEYERIPWIWRVAVAAGKQNDAHELHEILQTTLPQIGAPLHDWQAVVIGGGVINGISLAGVPPEPRIAEILKSDKDTALRYAQCLKQAAAMADNVQVREGTRYDALRIIAMQPWEVCGTQLRTYLKEGVSEELQAGAISGCLDIHMTEAIAAILSSLPHAPVANRDLALDGLLRDEAGQRALLLAILDGQLTREALGPDRLLRLRKYVETAKPSLR